MFETLWSDTLAWWATVPPDFAFLLVLPFVVAGLGLAALGWRGHRRPTPGRGRTTDVRLARPN